MCLLRGPSCIFIRNQSDFRLQVAVPWLKRLVAALSTTEALVWSQFIPREICSGQNNTGTGFSLSTSGFPCQYYSTNVPYTTLSTRYS